MHGIVRCGFSPQGLTSPAGNKDLAMREHRKHNEGFRPYRRADA